MLHNLSEVKFSLWWNKSQSTIDLVFLLSRDQRDNRQDHWKGNICKKNFFGYLSFCKLYPKGGMYLTIITVLILNVFGSRPSPSPKIYQGMVFCTKRSRLQAKYGQFLITSSEILIATNSVVIRQQKDFFLEKCIALFIETVRFSTSPPVKGNWFLRRRTK